MKQKPAAFDLLLVVVMFAIPAGTVTAPLSEYDTGWHLRTGEWIVKNRAIPHIDTFSTVGEEMPWIAYSWLYGVGLYGVYESFGLMGILVCRVGLSLTIVAALYFLVRRGNSGPGSVAVVAAASIALVPLLVSERPGLFSILFVIWTLEATLSVRDGRCRWTIWLLPAVYALWANIHIQWVHGLFILGLAWLATLIEVVYYHGRAEARKRPESSLPPDSNALPSKTLKRLTVLLTACCLATLFNPYAYQLYDVVLTYARQKQTYQMFEELKSIAFRQPADWCVLGLTCLACFALGRRSRLDLFEILLLAAGAYFSFRARHDTWFIVLAACIVLARTMSANELFGWRGRPVEVAAPAWWLVPLIAVVVLTGRCLLSGTSEERLQQEQREEFPVAAAAFLEQTSLPGPIYNPIDWGGYLIWRLPGYQVGIDGRSQLHGEQRTKRFHDVWQGRPGWSNDPDLRGAGVVLLQQTSPLAELLRRSPDWREVHADNLSVVFVRKR